MSKSDHCNYCQNRPFPPAPITAPQRPDWQCGVCGRLWREMVERSGVRYWVEVRGAREEAT